MSSLQDLAIDEGGEQMAQQQQQLPLQAGPAAGGQVAAAEAGVRESIRGSRSFDEGVLSEIKKSFSDIKVRHP